MPKQLWIIANWKSHKNIQEALEWVNLVGPKLERRDNIKVVVCPSFVCLEEVKRAVLVGNYPILVGSQDLSPFSEGPYTGEESAVELTGIADLAILGHSERRQNFGETDTTVAKKVKQALTASIQPLVCIQGPDTPIPVDCKLVAFEPVEAIGSGHPDTPEDAAQVAAQVKKGHSDLEVLYGGSVTSKNSQSFMKEESLSGLLIGGASLDAKEFVKIVESAYGL